MADYRFIVRSVRYWRGNIQRTSRSYEFTGSGTTPDVTALQTLYHYDTAMCYGAGANAWGTYEAQVYHAGGGVPIATYTTGVDYENPATWGAVSTPATNGWATTAGYTFEPAAEVALAVKWQAGLGSTGKPVYFRKWWHAVPKSQSVTGAQDIVAGNVTTLTAAALALQTCLSPTYGLVLGNASRIASTSPIVSAFYENHQMPRGRRRTSVSRSGVKYKIGATPTIEPGDVVEGE